MSRFENVGQEVNEYCERTGEGSSTFDLCSRRGPKMDGAPTPPHWIYNGDPVGELVDTEECAPDGYGGDEDYHCQSCDKKLTDKDN
jgi:hypothetical protein